MKVAVYQLTILPSASDSVWQAMMEGGGGGPSQGAFAMPYGKRWHDGGWTDYVVGVFEDDEVDVIFLVFKPGTASDVWAFSAWRRLGVCVAAIQKAIYEWESPAPEVFMGGGFVCGIGGAGRQDRPRHA